MLEQPRHARATGEALRQALLAPRRIALVGASDDQTKTAARPLQYLRRIGFAGDVYPINPRRDSVGGERTYRSLEAVPERPDHVYILTPTDAAIGVVEECARLGIPVATVLADGFSSGAAAERRSRALRDICERAHVRLVGPSCLGVVNLRERMILTANAAFAEPDLPVGRIFAASQSGAMIGALISRGKARGVGFAGLVSVGNEIDVSAGEVCAATLDDPDIDGYLLFLETLRHADALRRFALGAAERAKPVVVYKLGRSAEARELTVTHTGALAGEDDVAEAFFADCGIARVATFEALIETLPLLRRMPILPQGAPKPRIGVITTTGGAAAMVVDQLGVRGLPVVKPSAETIAAIAALAGIEIEPGRIIDLTLAGARYPVMKAALDIMLSAPEFDMIVTIVGSTARFQPNLVLQPIIDSVGSDRPFVSFVSPEAPEALVRLTEAGVPCFRTPEACADAVAAAVRRRSPKPIVASGSSWRRSWPSTPSPTLTLPRKRGREERGQKDVDARHRAGHDGGYLEEAEAYELLDTLGLARARAKILPVNLARAPALPFPYPVAVKALSADIAHKTDAGGVTLNIMDGEALVRAVRAMRKSVAKRRPDAVFDRVLVQPMVSGVGEVLIGYRIDPDAGPLVLLAAGGVLTEILQDRVLRLAPVDLAEAKAMIAEMRALKALAGYRGRPAGDLDALAQAIVALSQLALRDEPVLEAEINPLMVLRSGQGVVAVDALVRLAR